MGNNIQKANTNKAVTFSKDTPIIEISSKQSQTQNITPPAMPKESKKK